jgi:beta-galactosidase
MEPAPVIMANEHLEVRLDRDTAGGAWYVERIAVRTPQGWQVVLTGEPGREFATTLGAAGAATCDLRRSADGTWQARLAGSGTGWEAHEELTLRPGEPRLRRRQTYRFTAACTAAIGPGFRLRPDPASRYTYPLRAHEQPLAGLPALRAAVDWALPFPFHVWHNGAVLALYGLDKRRSPGTLDFAPVTGTNEVRLGVYYPDTAAQPTDMRAPGFGQPRSPGLTPVAAGAEVTLHEVIAARPLGPDEEPLLEAERLAAGLLLDAPAVTAAGAAAVAAGIAAFYRHCELWEPDALGPGRGWFTNMWIHTQAGTAAKRGEMSGYYDLGWGEGIAVEMMLGAVRYWQRTGDACLLPYVDTMTSSLECFKRAPGADQPYFDRSDGRRFGDFLMDHLPGQRLWTHALGHTGSQLLQMWQAVPEYPNPAARHEWLAAATSMAGFLARQQRPDGDLQDIFDERDHEVNTKPHRITARAVVCGLWARLGQITGDAAWTERALRLATAVAPAIRRYEYCNQMLDGIISPTNEYVDGEAAYYVLEGLVPLYAASREPSVLALCRKAAAFGIAWTYFYDLPQAHAGRARGGQCCRMGDFPLLYPIGPAKAMTPLLDLYTLTGDPLFATLAAETAAFICAWQVDAPGKPWHGGMIHALGQYCGKHWGPGLEGQVDTGMATGNCLAALEAWLAYVSRTPAPMPPPEVGRAAPDCQRQSRPPEPRGHRQPAVQGPRGAPPLAPPRARFPFIFGAQYYRAPTPEPECWETDFRAMRDLGFNEVKYFVQWRWSHRAVDRFYFDDLDRLMDLAGAHGLGVTLNILLDMSPLWLFERHPDARQIDASGHTVEPYAVGHRSIGGHPGPCYSHAGARVDRQRFVAATVEHFRPHPALHMWDVWNEPELCFPQRQPNLATLACYCRCCQAAFGTWLRRKYGDLDRLNAVWGRCYESWEQAEMPRGPGGVTDFVDWREFHLDTLTAEAAWRLDTVRQLDPEHGRYLHVVPNTWFNPVTCVDDFAMAEPCEVFAATMNGGPSPCLHIVSAARAKVCYNVESHINFGSIDMHQRELDLPKLLADFLPQLGMGIKGFLFWQYRPEVLGVEAPAWGLVRPDGSPRPVTAAARQFWATLRPHAAALREAFPETAAVGIWRSRKNEIFHFATQGTVTPFSTAVDAYVNALYWDNLPCRIISGEMLAAAALDGLRLLILPSAYYLTEPEAAALDGWVRAGGVLLCEAHLGGYNGSSGRHSRTLPGCGLAQTWGFTETESTASCHLRLSSGHAAESAALPEDVRKAVRDFGVAGGRFFPIVMADGTLLWGAHRYAELAGAGLEPLGRFDGRAPCIARQRVGAGLVFYCGTCLGQAAERDPASVRTLVRLAATAAGLGATGRCVPERPQTVHLDLLGAPGAPRFAVVISAADQEQTVQLSAEGLWRGLFSGVTWTLRGSTTVRVPGRFVELFAIDKLV